MNDEQIASAAFNQEVKIRIYVETSLAQSISIKFNIYDDKKVNLTGCDFFQAGQELLLTECGGLYLAEYDLRLPLQEGNYSVRVQITSSMASGATIEFLDVIDDAVVFQMVRWETARAWSKVHLFPKLSLKKLS
jgi:lipopolysaccharide transport system ATP-binding protein